MTERESREQFASALRKLGSKRDPSKMRAADWFVRGLLAFDAVLLVLTVVPPFSGAWPYLEERCASLRPNDHLFPGIDRWEASDAHRAACKLAEIEGYQLRDQRHSYAVRAARGGTPAELISRQLGHANAVLVLMIYGRFMPSQQDRDKWERLCDIQDQESAAACTVACTPPRNDMSQPLVSDWLIYE